MKKKRIFHSILVSVFILIALNIKVKGQEKVIELNGAITSNQDKVARDAIILKPGFSTGTFEFSASINEDMICDAEYLSGTSIPIAQERNIDTDLPVGTTPGSFNVSPSGAATYTIPITVPPGTAGVQPSVAVTYNSQAGNGIMGMGWNLAGISAITRVPSSIYHDGANNVDGVDFDDMDKFALDGNRLIVTSGTYGDANSIYKTEITDFSEITAYGTAGNGPSYFKLVTKDKKVLEFGNTANSKIEAEGKSDVLIWYLNKITDTKGNYIVYEYYENNATGEFYPKKISYTGTSTYSPYNTIEFFYEDRTDKSTAYVGGAEINQNVLLYRIKVTADGELVKNYYFEYKKDTYSKLVKVSESDNDYEQFNATIFEWGTETANPYVSYKNFGGDNYYFHTGDFNGDGRQDLLKFPKQDDFVLDDKWEVYLNSSTLGTSFTKPSNGEGYLVEAGEYPIGGYLFPDGSYTSYINYLNTSGAASSDLNGDGLDDFIRIGFRPKNYDVETLEDTWLIIPMYSTASSSGECYFTEGSWMVFTKYEPQIFLGDFDGDNVTEIISYQDKNGISEWTINDCTKNPVQQILGYTGSISSSDKILTGDIDGDGKMELFHFISSGYKIYSYNSASDSFDEKQDNQNCFWPSNDDNIYLSDYNGDGKSDVIAYTSNNFGPPSESDWMYAFFNGKSFERSTAKLSLEAPGTSDDNHNVYLGDFNFDGKTDIMQVNRTWIDRLPTSYYATRASYFYFDGVNFITESKELSDNYAYNHYFTIGDFNGDGRSDLVYYSNDDSQHKIIVDNPNGNERFIKKFTNGLNLTTEVNYGVLPNSSYYDAGTYQGNAQVMDFKGPLYFVTMAYAKDLIKGQTHYTKTWHYDNALLHRHGKGFLGFMEVEEDNVTSLSEIRTTFNYNTNFYNVYPEKTTTKYRYKILSETTNTNDNLEPNSGLKIIFPYIEEQVSIDKLKDVTITTNNSYYANGNLESVTVDYNGEGVSTTLYEDYTSTHSKPQTITVTKQRGTESFTRKKSLTYDTYGLLATETADPLKTNWVKNTYTRDTYGNITQVKTESPNLDTRITYNTFDDSKHQFIRTKTNAELHSENFTYDPAYGNILTHTDANGLLTKYDYDGFGRLTKTTLPSGKVINTTLHWDNNNSDFSKVIYYSKSSSTGSPESRTYTDQLGRKWLDETQGYNGTFVRIESNFNSNLQLSGKTLPYYQGGTKTWETYSYIYADGRINTVTLGADVKTYTYTPNSSIVSVTDAGDNSVTKDYNAYGQLDEVTDEGGTITYSYYGHGGVKTITSNGATYTVEYDEYERQKKLIDPDAGTIHYVYNAYGELAEQTDAVGNKYTFEYDKLGRLETKTLDGGEAVTYVYDTEANGVGLLASVSTSDKTISYTYDDLSRIKEITKDITGDTYFDNLTFEYEYNASGDVTKITYPSDFFVTNTYNTYGYLTTVKRGDNNTTIWSSPSYNAMGQITGYTQGNGITTTRNYTAYGLPVSIEAGTIQDSEYSFNQSNSTLTWRKNHKHKNGSNVSFTETFGYDELYRLTGVTYNNGITDLDMTYNGINGASNGTIASKTDIGTYSYTGTRPHALSEIPGYSPNYDTYIDYTPFKKVSEIIALDRQEITNYAINITYGPEEQRWKTVLNENDINFTTKYFDDDYEIVVDNAGNAKHLHYIYADPGVVSVMEQQGTTKNMHYIHTDYLGSIEYITNASGTVEQELSYDAWGRLREPSTWLYSITPPMFGRGFTMHEYSTELNLINMNGRVYDPVIGVFLSPDNYVQAPDYTQNFNRYGYAFNNPLMYSDPSGDWIIPLITTVAGAYLGGVQSNGFEFNPGNWDWGSPGTWMGMVQGGIGGYGFGTSVEQRLNAFSDIQKIRSGELPSLYEAMNPPESAGHLLASTDGLGKVPTEGTINYKEETYRFQGENWLADPAEKTGADFSASQNYRGHIQIKKHYNNRWYAQAYAETRPGEVGGYKISANLRVYQNGESTGFQYLSMKNEWTKHYYDATVNRLGYARLYLPTTGTVKVQITITSFKYKFFFGNRLHTIYQGYINFP